MGCNRLVQWAGNVQVPVMTDQRSATATQVGVIDSTCNDAGQPDHSRVHTIAIYRPIGKNRGVFLLLGETSGSTWDTTGPAGGF